jgi:hypothetical protein
VWAVGGATYVGDGDVRRRPEPISIADAEAVLRADKDFGGQTVTWSGGYGNRMLSADTQVLGHSVTLKATHRLRGFQVMLQSPGGWGNLARLCCCRLHDHVAHWHYFADIPGLTGCERAATAPLTLSPEGATDPLAASASATVMLDWALDELRVKRLFVQGGMA